MHAPTETNRKQNERGMVLWTVLALVFTLGGLSIGLLWEGMAERASVEHRQRNLYALQICEMGFSHASMEIVSLKDQGTDGIGVVSGDYGGGDYEVKARQQPGYPDRWILTATGEHGLSRKRIEAGVRRREHSDWAESLFAKDGVVFNGDSQTDSYDSRLGTYASQAVNSDAGGVYADGGGHVGSNTNIEINGSSAVLRGNAIPGPLAETILAGSPTIWGDVLARRRDIPIGDLPLSEFEAALASNNNGELEAWAVPGKNPYDKNKLSIRANAGDEIVLTGGTYFFTDLTFNGGATLRVKGPTVLYITGGFDLGGGALVNETGIPSDLIIKAHPYPLPGNFKAVSPVVKFNGGPASALAVYAPNVPIVVGGDSHVYGALLGESITVNGSANFHYDRALGTWSKYTTVVVERLYWRDLEEKLR